jgi:hypothetical protein
MPLVPPLVVQMQREQPLVDQTEMLWVVVQTVPVPGSRLSIIELYITLLLLLFILISE